MPDTKNQQFSYISGELSPELLERPDIKLYATGAAELTNFDILQYGPLRKRAGSEHVVNLPASRRIFPYQPTDTDSYILLFSNTDIEIRSGVDGSYVDTVAHGLSSLDDVSITGVQDIVYVFSPNHPPRELVRNTTTSFSMRTSGWFYPFDNPLQFNVTPSGTGGTITVTSDNGTVFTDAYLNRQLLIQQQISKANRVQQLRFESLSNGITYTSHMKVVPGKELTLTTEGRWWGSVIVQRSQDLSTWTDVEYITSIDASNNVTRNIEGDEGIWYYRLGYDKVQNPTDPSGGVTLEQQGKFFNGIVEITAVNNTSTCTGVVKSSLQDTTKSLFVSPSFWGGNSGFPTKATIHQRRLVMAGNKGYTNVVWGSDINKYKNFYTDTLFDNDAYVYTLDGEEYNSIQWVVSKGDQLFLGTGTAEWIIEGLDRNSITPESARVKKMSNIGSTKDPGGFVLAESLVFFTGSGRKLTEYVYNFDSDAFTQFNLTSAANHIFQVTPAKRSFVGRNPLDKLYTIREDGVLCQLSFSKGDGLIAWNTYNTDGDYLDLAVISSQGQDSDTIFAVVDRGTHTTLEVWKPGRDLDFYNESNLNWRYMDCWQDLGAVNIQDTITRPTVYEGKEVVIYADGVLMKRYAADEDLVMQFSATQTIIGFPYKAEFKTLTSAYSNQSAFVHAQFRNQKEVLVSVYKTGVFEIDGVKQTFDGTFREDENVMNTNGLVSVYSGWVKMRVKSPGNVRRDSISISSEDPYPLQINQHVLEIKVGDY